MSELVILIVLYAVGMLILLAEIFIPSHGILTLAGVGFLAAAVTRTFSYGGRDAGVIAIMVCLVVLPTLAFYTVKYWPRTPIGRRIAPPNPVFTAADSGVPLEQLSKLVGQTGRSISPLRPVGTCEIGGRRVSCIAEFGMVDAGVLVEATGISGSNLSVVEKKA